MEILVKYTFYTLLLFIIAVYFLKKILHVTVFYRILLLPWTDTHQKSTGIGRCHTHVAVDYDFGAHRTSLWTIVQRVGIGGQILPILLRIPHPNNLPSPPFPSLKGYVVVVCW